QLGREQLELPSQQYSFALVRAPVRRRAIIVLMRKGKLKMWLCKVPELDGYDRLIQLNNPQNPTISPGNCRAGDYEQVVVAIARQRRAPRARAGPQLDSGRNMPQESS
ncbi:MAG: hypothetical protein L0215_11615, partial [Gemmataceae bacterium]|nr:hypothetical protein [Gemmataceae bacterium]